MMQTLRGRLTFCSKCSVTRSSFSRCKFVFTEVTNAVNGSNVQRRGKSYAASVPSNIPKLQKGWKRVSKDERQAMVETYVNKYRATHAGKFPTASDAKKQVGGSYYVVRKILQELEFKYKFSSSNGENEFFLRRELSKEDESLAEVKEVSISSRMTVDAVIQNDPHAVAIFVEEINDPSDNHLEAEGELQASSWAKKILPKEGGHSDLIARHSNLLKGDGKHISHSCLEKAKDDKMKEAQSAGPDFITIESHMLKEDIQKVSHQCLQEPEDSKYKEALGIHTSFAASESQLVNGEAKEGSQSCLENGEDEKKRQSVSEHLPDSDCQKYEAELEKYATDISGRQNNDTELAKKSTLWGNLKLFADGIINMWRKR